MTAYRNFLLKTFLKSVTKTVNIPAQFSTTIMGNKDGGGSVNNQTFWVEKQEHSCKTYLYVKTLFER